MDVNDELVAQLMAARTIIENALRMLAQQAAAPPVCQHLNREDLSPFGGHEHWVCRDCGYEYGAPDGE